jgi:hypothetical protein
MRTQIQARKPIRSLEKPDLECAGIGLKEKCRAEWSQEERHRHGCVV